MPKPTFWQYLQNRLKFVSMLNILNFLPALLTSQFAKI